MRVLLWAENLSPDLSGETGELRGAFRRSLEPRKLRGAVAFCKELGLRFVMDETYSLLRGADTDLTLSRKAIVHTTRGQRRVALPPTGLEPVPLERESQ